MNLNLPRPDIHCSEFFIFCQQNDSIIYTRQPMFFRLTLHFQLTRLDFFYYQFNRDITITLIILNKRNFTGSVTSHKPCQSLGPLVGLLVARCKKNIFTPNSKIRVSGILIINVNTFRRVTDFGSQLTSN